MYTYIITFQWLGKNQKEMALKGCPMPIPSPWVEILSSLGEIVEKVWGGWLFGGFFDF